MTGHGYFYDNLNRATTMLEPAQRRSLNLVLQACEVHGLSLPDALQLCVDDPTALPDPVWWALRDADDASVFESIGALFIK